MKQPTFTAQELLLSVLQQENDGFVTLSETVLQKVCQELTRLYDIEEAAVDLANQYSMETYPSSDHPHVIKLKMLLGVD